MNNIDGEWARVESLLKRRMFRGMQSTIGRELFSAPRRASTIETLESQAILQFSHRDFDEDAEGK